MTSRRLFIQIGALGVIAPAVFAQTKPVKVGVLSAITKSFYAPVVIQRLGELGYREGSTMALEFRSAEGKAERFPQLAQELLALNCDLIIAIGPEDAARALRDRQSNVPVVFLAIDYDPLEKGIVQSLVRPGRNMTGVTALHKEIAVKRLEVAREVLPWAQHFLVLSDRYNAEQLQVVKQAADLTKTRLTIVELEPPHDYASALEAGRRAKANALVLLTSPVFADRRMDILAAAVKARMPIIGFATPDAVFPIGYSASAVSMARRAGEIAVRILKGAKAGEIPVEQAQEFELQVNLTAAKTLGMKIPYSILARTTRLVE